MNGDGFFSILFSRTEKMGAMSRFQTIPGLSRVQRSPDAVVGFAETRNEFEFIRRKGTEFDYIFQKRCVAPVPRREAERKGNERPPKRRRRRGVPQSPPGHRGTTEGEPSPSATRFPGASTDGDLPSLLLPASSFGLRANAFLVLVRCVVFGLDEEMKYRAPRPWGQAGPADRRARARQTRLPAGHEFPGLGE
ncbi:hypothetical protein C2845_PM04G04540 [Panicum miliaceum]|uniref:Uncharacterized protein n=1 Tax=Panicum miliaceum TaxID=4540 RepID=A0A3L6QPF2_PANMI|nr:hypothetical protein C2845_PM04G04540 [Panicum miliaceum]